MKDLRRWLLGVFSVAALAGGPYRCAGDMPAIQGLAWSGYVDELSYLMPGEPTATLGWSFDVFVPVEVTALGLFDTEGSGLTQAHRVAIWNTALGGPLVEATVPANNLAGAEVYWTPVAPSLLAPGSYVIGAEYFASGDGVEYMAGYPTTPSGIIGYDDILSRSGEWGVPTRREIRRCGFFGPNFQFRELGGDPVPEAATLLPLMCFLSIAGGWLHCVTRRKRTGVTEQQ